MNRNRFTIAAVIGAVAGIVAGVLIAPRSGSETRADLKAKANELKRETERRANEAKELARARAAEAKEYAEDYKTRGEKAIHDTIDGVKQSYKGRK